MQVSENNCNIDEYQADHRIENLQTVFAGSVIGVNQGKRIAKAFYSKPLITHHMDKISRAINIISKGSEKSPKRWGRKFMAKCLKAKKKRKCKCQALTKQCIVLEQHCKEVERRNETLKEVLSNERRNYQSDQQKFKIECQAYKNQVTNLHLSTRIKEEKLNELDEKLSIIKNLTTCQICRKKLTKPSSAECGHIFCNNCLKRNRTPKGLFTCPICRRTTRPRRQRQVFMLTDLTDHVHKEEPKPTDSIVIDSDSD